MAQVNSSSRFLRRIQPLFQPCVSFLLALSYLSGARILVTPPAIAQLAKSTEPLPVSPEASATPAPIQPFRGSPISVARLKQMKQDLADLESSYELALASAGVYSTESRLMRDLLDNLASEEEGNGTASTVSPRYVGLVNALNQAKQYRRDFGTQVEQQNYLQATQSWLKAKNLLRDYFPTGQRDVSPQIRAIWLDRGTIVEAKSQEDLTPLFDRMQRAGINVVFFETVNAGYPIYPSNVAPQQNPLTEGWDPLEAAIALAHDRDMELHAWVWTFATANQRHNEILGLPKDHPGPVLAQHPTWAIHRRDGKRPELISGKSFLDPANPKVRDYIQSLLDEIVTRYPVDGVQLDYIRYPFQNPTKNNIHGFSLTARKAFLDQYQVDPIQLSPGDHHWQNWLNFKAEKIDSFVAQTAQFLKQKNPDLILSTAVFPMPTQIRHQNLQQNWQRWVQAGWVDLLVPMTYASNTPDFQDLMEPLFAAEFQGDSLMLPGLRLLDMPSYKTLEQVQYLQRTPTSGYALFAAAHFRSSLAGTLNRPAVPATPLVLHRAPLDAAAIAYQGLTREWQYWLARHRPDLGDDLERLAPWAEQVDQVSQAFDQLLANPDTPELASVADGLAQLQSSSMLFTLEPVLAPSQRQQWAYQLQRIQRIVAYGKRQLRERADQSLASGAGE